MKSLALAFVLVLSAPSAFASYYWASCACTDSAGSNIGPVFGADYSPELAVKAATDMCTDSGGIVGVCTVEESQGGGR